jgi:hypothetical protein
MSDSWDDFDSADGPLEKLADGNFEGRIVKRSDRKIEGKDGKPPGRILTLQCEILVPSDGTEEDLCGEEITWDQWLTRPEAKKILMQGLERVGFEVKSWGDPESEFPMRKMLPLALKYLVVQGPTLKLAKKTTKSSKDNREFPNIYMNGRVLADGESKVIPNDAVMAVAAIPEADKDLF